MIDLHAEAEIDCLTERVWLIVADYGHDAEWRAGVVTMEPPDRQLVDLTDAAVP